jgi:hypothetical protein
MNGSLWELAERCRNKDTSFRPTARQIHTAIKVPTVRLLLEQSADLNAGRHSPPFMDAPSMAEYTDIVCHLLERGADAGATGNQYGNGPGARRARFHIGVPTQNGVHPLKDGDEVGRRSSAL